MSMREFFTREEATETVRECKEGKEMLFAEIDKLNKYIIILEYYLRTGKALKPSDIGLEDEEND